MNGLRRRGELVADHQVEYMREKTNADNTWAAGPVQTPLLNRKDNVGPDD